MTPKHVTEVNILRMKMRRLKFKVHVAGCPGCQSKLAAKKAAHMAKVAQETGKAPTPQEDASGTSMILKKVKDASHPAHDAFTAVFGGGGGKVH